MEWGAPLRAFALPTPAASCYRPRMARKSASSESHRGFGDVIAVTLLAAALLLLVSQWSFDRYDLASNLTPPNQPVFT